MVSPLELKPGLRRDIAISRFKLQARENYVGDSWPRRESEFTAYMSHFGSIIGEYEVINELKDKKSPTVIDLMASTEALASLFYDLPQEGKLGISVGRKDARTSWQRSRDEGFGIEMISSIETPKGEVKADITSWKTWRRIQERLAGRKADLIIEYGGHGLDFVPAGLEFHIAIARWAWRLLSSDNGLILAQTRSQDELMEEGIYLDDWVNKLNECGIPAKRVEDPNERVSLIMIRKTPDSPKRLPLLH